MANISGNWNKSMPSGTSLVSQGDDLMRQHWGSLEDTLEEEHYFADTPGSAGIHKAGASRISYGDLSALKSSDTEGRLYYAVDDQSLYITGASATTKLSGAQQGGPVRSVVSDTFGWYISSYTTANKLSTTTYKYINSSGNPMTFREGSQRVIGMSMATSGGFFSGGTFPGGVMPHSVTSSGVKAHTWYTGSELGGASAGVEEALINRYIIHATFMGLIPVSEMS